MNDLTAKILTIDDEASIRSSIVAYLEDSGFEIIEAENGRVGIEQCRSEQPDLVLCDLRMPEVDGLDVLAKVTKEFPEMPFIVVSGMGGLGDAIEALKLGAWDYITKPIQDMAVLEHAIRKSLERSRLLQQNEEYKKHLEAVNRQLKESLQQLEQDEEAGREMQFQLLPENETLIQQCEYSRRLLPSMYLSGDFIDYFQIDEQRTGFYMADVSGHGVSSAFVTVLLKSYMSRYLEDFWQKKDEVILNPESVLMRLNRTLLENHLDKYLTMFYGVIDVAGQTLRFSNGGHFPYPLLFDGKETVYLASKNKPVGLFKDSNYTTEEISLPKQFVLALFSDGIFEAIQSQRLKDKEAYLLSLINKMDVTIDTLIEKTIGTNKDTALPDDITLLMVKRTI
jgi:phosphoserine phosphatase RsbU/P